MYYVGGLRISLAFTLFFITHTKDFWRLAYCQTRDSGR